MSFSYSMSKLAAVTAVSLLAALPAHAGFGRVQSSGSSADTASGVARVSTFIDVNMAGWTSTADFGDPANSEVFLPIGIGSTVTGFDYINLSFTTSNGSYLWEFVISVNSTDGAGFLDAAPSDIAAAGTFGPASGSWDTALGGQIGEPFSVPDGTVWVYVYELYDDPGLDATVNSGTLRIYYDTTAVVPEPSTYGLMGLGALAVVAAARRRRRAD